MNKAQPPSLESYDALGVCAGCAALLLDPRNADNADYLTSLEVAAQRSAKGTQEPDWGALLPGIASFHTQGFRWDAYETVWVEPLGFIGGPFLLFTDGNPESVFGLRLVLQAIFMSEGVGEVSDKRRLLDLCLAVLRLSDHLARAAGAKRYMTAVPRRENGVALPDSKEFELLQQAVTFSEAELEAETGKSVSVLAPLIRDLDTDGPIPNSETGAPRTELFPLLKRDGRYVAASPASLAAALRHQILIELLDAGHQEQLCHRLWRAALAEVVRSMSRLGWELGASKEPQEGESFGQAAFGFDDLVAVVTILVDNLDNYDADAPDSMWEAIALNDRLEKEMGEAEEMTFFGIPPRPRDLIQIVVFAGVGRSVIFGIAGEEPGEAPRLILSLEALTTISYSGVDNLELWKFAEAGGRLREQTKVMFASPLDEYAAWREMQRTFYFGDEGRPTLVQFDSSYGRAFREKVGSERDVHAVANAGSITEVIRLAEDPEVPVYVPVLDLFDPSDQAPRLLVEHGATQIWIRAEADAAKEDRRAYGQMVDCIAFWLWQLSPSFPTLTWGEIEVEVILDSPGVWRSQSEAPETDGSPVAEIELAYYDRLRVTVFPQMVSKLNQPDNQAERELGAVLLRGIGDLAAVNGAESLSREQVEAAIEAHAPLGPKKKINLITEVNEAALLDGPLPPVRYIQDPDPEAFLDEAGRFARDELGLSVGPIPDERRGEVLNAIVAHHLDELRALIATLSPDGLLEYLIDHHEALLHRQAVSQIKFPSEVAAYGAGQKLQQLRKEIPDSANAGVALRFLIEYVAACPPRGLRPISLDFFDRLLALASQIANRGWASDVVRYGLGAGLELSVLESGRLGKREKTYFSGQEAYLDARVPSVADIALRSYRSHWGESKDVSEGLIDRLDVAADAEWGVTMRELGQLFGEISNAALRRRAAACAVPRSELIAELSQELDFSEQRIERGLELLALTSRDDFLAIPKPFKRPDLYPWRFNRELSYLRRPLIVRETNGDPEIVWGPRHLEAAGHYLIDLVTSERLKAKSPQMKELMTQLRQEETAAFVEEVARRLREAAMVVKTNVEKIAGMRVTRPNGKDAAGDLDVLAADPKRKVLHVREVKDLEGARTPAELTNELQANFAVNGEKRSAADRHLERIAWVEDHLEQVLDYLGIEPEVGWRVAGGFVVDIEVLSPYVSECPLPITPIDRLLEELSEA